MRMTERTMIKDGKSLTLRSNRLNQDTLNQNVRIISLYLTIYIDPFKQSTLIRDFNELYSKIYNKEKYINL